MKCEFCNNEFSNKQNLNSHQRKTKYCLKIQGIDQKNIHKCDGCLKSFTVTSNYRKHLTTCKKNDLITTMSDRITILENENKMLKHDVKRLENDKEKIRSDYKELSITAIKRPVNNTKNIQINNYIKNMLPLLETDITNNIQNLTLEHHTKGAEGYAEYALEFPFKNKIVCVDVSRNKIKYKNEDGDIIEDIGFKKMMIKLCKSLKDRSFSLSQEHYEKLSDTFTTQEMDDFNFMETALAITKLSCGRENDFCNKIVKMISKGVIVNE